MTEMFRTAYRSWLRASQRSGDPVEDFRLDRNLALGSSLRGFVLPSQEEVLGYARESALQYDPETSSLGVYMEHDTWTAWVRLMQWLSAAESAERPEHLFKNSYEAVQAKLKERFPEEYAERAALQEARKANPRPAPRDPFADFEQQWKAEIAAKRAASATSNTKQTCSITEWVQPV